MSEDLSVIDSVVLLRDFEIRKRRRRRISRERKKNICKERGWLPKEEEDDDMASKAKISHKFKLVNSAHHLISHFFQFPNCKSATNIQESCSKKKNHVTIVNLPIRPSRE
ncbi:hypothetical protein LguiA_025705 [Lonicera macranthoides]